MNLLQFILGLKDKEQAARTQEVMDIVHNKKNEFNVQMKNLKNQAGKVHTKASKSMIKSADILIMTADITTRIAIVTGSVKLK